MKAVITKRHDSERMSVTYFESRFSRPLHQGEVSSLREGVQLVDSFDFMTGCKIDVRHCMKKDSSWHKIR